MLVVFSPIFVADTKIIYGPNLVAPLRTLVKETFVFGALILVRAAYYNIP